MIPTLGSLSRRHAAAAAAAAALAGASWAPPSFLRLGAALFTTAAPARAKKWQHPPRPKPPPEEEIHESFLKGSGPGGQKINKTNSAVQLKHLPTGIVIKCQETRSREQNRKIARELLAARLDDQLNGENSRSAVVARFEARRKASAGKKSRRKYRKLEEQGEEGAGAEGEGGPEEPTPSDQLEQTTDQTEPQQRPA